MNSTDYADAVLNGRTTQATEPPAPGDARWRRELVSDLACLDAEALEALAEDLADTPAGRMLARATLYLAGW